jgi:hypothetical protein
MQISPFAMYCNAESVTLAGILFHLQLRPPAVETEQANTLNLWKVSASCVSVCVTDVDWLDSDNRVSESKRRKLESSK